MDPPWQLASSHPTRGVSIGYKQLSDSIIADLPIALLQDSGLLFMWVINAKYRFALSLLDKWGYRCADLVSQGHRHCPFAACIVDLSVMYSRIVALDSADLWMRSRG